MLSPIAKAYADLEGKPAILEAELKACRTALGDKHPSTLRVMNNLAVSLVDKGEMAKALTYFSKALEIGERELGRDADLTQLVRARLRELLH